MGKHSMSKNRFGEHDGAKPSAASVVPSGFNIVSTSALPAPLAEAAAAQQELYRLAYQRACEAAETARRSRRWLYCAVQEVSRN